MPTTLISHPFYIQLKLNGCTLAWIYLNVSVRVKYYTTSLQGKNRALDMYLLVISIKTVLKNVELDEVH